jgi:hypothetical protein
LGAFGIAEAGKIFGQRKGGSEAKKDTEEEAG